MPANWPSITARITARWRDSSASTPNMAAMFRLPAAGCPMAATNGRWSRGTEPARQSDRYPHRGAKTAHRAVAERDVSAMRTGDVAGDRKSQAGAALVLVAGVIQ